MSTENKELNAFLSGILVSLALIGILAVGGVIAGTWTKSEIIDYDGKTEILGTLFECKKVSK